MSVFLTEFESELEKFARDALNETPTSLTESILYSLLSGGKRIRPRIILSLSNHFQLKKESALRLATALEMIHVYTLIHDDLPAMDNDDFRRGKPSNHKAHGEALAILAGDSLALLAFDILTPLENLSLIRCLLEASGARGVIAGQVAELELNSNKNPSVENLFEVFRLKTGALFKAAFLLPALASPVKQEPSLLSSLEKMGEALGIAFQIADDLEDDFNAHSKNFSHIAAYFTKNEAMLKAEEILGAAFAHLERTSSDLAKILTPIMDELAKKIKP